MNSTVSLVITSIASPNEVMKACASGAARNNVRFIVIGDVKSPASFELDGCEFFSIPAQDKLSFRLSKSLPQKHYSRKNIGYLLAKDSDVIIETDDDNFPLAEFWSARERKVRTHKISGSRWLNVYRHFAEDNIWPRGFPLESIHGSSDFQYSAEENLDCPIQQGLADENPDVDAVYRMTSTLPVSFLNKNSVAPSEDCWCPFNSQNTTWFKDAFPLLYLPSFCSFRMTDIWRSFVAQRIAWTCGWNILFHSSTVVQERNEHNLLRDFEEEIPGYLHNNTITRLLDELDLPSGVKNIPGNLLKCYEMLTEKKFTGEKEPSLVNDWLHDIL